MTKTILTLLALAFAGASIANVAGAQSAESFTTIPQSSSAPLDGHTAGHARHTLGEWEEYFNDILFPGHSLPPSFLVLDIPPGVQALAQGDAYSGHYADTELAFGLIPEYVEAIDFSDPDTLAALMDPQSVDPHSTLTPQDVLDGIETLLGVNLYAVVGELSTEAGAVYVTSLVAQGESGDGPVWLLIPLTEVSPELTDEFFYTEIDYLYELAAGRGPRFADSLFTSFTVRLATQAPESLPLFDELIDSIPAHANLFPNPEETQSKLSQIYFGEDPQAAAATFSPATWHEPIDAVPLIPDLLPIDEDDPWFEEQPGDDGVDPVSPDWYPGDRPDYWSPGDWWIPNPTEPVVNCSLLNEWYENAQDNIQEQFNTEYDKAFNEYWNAVHESQNGLPSAYDTYVAARRAAANAAETALKDLTGLTSLTSSLHRDGPGDQGQGFIAGCLYSGGRPPSANARYRGESPPSRDGSVDGVPGDREARVREV